MAGEKEAGVEGEVRRWKIESTKAALFAALQHQGWFSIKDASLDDALEIASLLGNPVPSLKGGTLVDELRPVRQEEARAKSLSAKHGLGAFPFHTDSANHAIPPRYVILRSAGIDASQRPTYLLDFEKLGCTREELLILYREVWLVNAGRGRFLTSILSEHVPSGKTILRYDMRSMRVAHVRFGQSTAIIEARLRMAKPEVQHWVPGEVLIINNWRVLHARGAQPDEDETRVLQRILVAEND